VNGASLDWLFFGTRPNVQEETEESLKPWPRRRVSRGKVPPRTMAVSPAATAAQRADDVTNG
jgi:hypothetical protein